MTTPSPLELATQLALRLANRGLRLVLAESCTGGRVAAALTSVPGISQHFCGSGVTYRDDTKVQWANVDPKTIAERTAVDQDVAIQMASGILSRTPEANIAASITGHLGPDAPPELDGVVYIGVADSAGSRATAHTLQGTDRHTRAEEATRLLLQILLDELA